MSNMCRMVGKTADMEKRSERVVVLMTPSELQAIDDWALEQRSREPRSEVIRKLIVRGLQHMEPTKPTAKKKPKPS